LGPIHRQRSSVRRQRAYASMAGAPRGGLSRRLSGQRSEAATREDVNGYLEQIGRLDGIADWPFVQIVEAIQNLLETAKAPVGVGWEFRRLENRILQCQVPA